MASALIRTLTIFSCCVFFAGCGGSKADSEVARQILIDGCMTGSDATLPFCRCMADFVVDRLEPDQHSLIVEIQALPEVPENDREAARQLGVLEMTLDDLARDTVVYAARSVQDCQAQL